MFFAILAIGYCDTYPVAVPQQEYGVPKVVAPAKEYGVPEKPQEVVVTSYSYTIPAAPAAPAPVYGPPKVAEPAPVYGAPKVVEPAPVYGPPAVEKNLNQFQLSILTLYIHQLQK